MRIIGKGIGMGLMFDVDDDGNGEKDNTIGMGIAVKEIG